MCQQFNKDVHSLSTRITILVNNCMFQHTDTKEMLKIILLSTQWGTMKLVIGSDLKTNNSLHTSPFPPIASFLRHDASSMRRPERRDEVTSPPSQQLQPPHHVFIRTPSLPIPSAPNVAILIHVTNAQPLASCAINAAACTITLPCVGDQGDPIIQPETPGSNLYTATKPETYEVVGPPEIILTTDPCPRVGAGRAAPQKEQVPPPEHQPKPISWSLQLFP